MTQFLVYFVTLCVFICVSICQMTLYPSRFKQFSIDRWRKSFRQPYVAGSWLSHDGKTISAYGDLTSHRQTIPEYCPVCFSVFTKSPTCSISILPIRVSFRFLCSLFVMSSSWSSWNREWEQQRDYLCLQSVIWLDQCYLIINLLGCQPLKCTNSSPLLDSAVVH